MSKQNFPALDLIVVNFYPFQKIVTGTKNYKQIIDNYQESKYVAQALYALSVYDQSADWELQLNNSFPNSIFWRIHSSIHNT